MGGRDAEQVGRRRVCARPGCGAGVPRVQRFERGGERGREEPREPEARVFCGRGEDGRGGLCELGFVRAGFALGLEPGGEVFEVAAVLVEHGCDEAGPSCCGDVGELVWVVREGPACAVDHGEVVGV